MKRLLFLLPILLGACATTPAPVATVANTARAKTPIVFIHGNGGSSAQWRSQLAHFRDLGHKAIAIDLPGFGTSPAPANGDYSLDAMAKGIDAAVDGEGLDRFVLVGHSYGGAVVANYAALYPDKVAGIVYVDAASTRLPLEASQKEQLSAALRADKMKIVRAWFTPMLVSSPSEVREEVFASVEQTSTEAFISALMSLTEFDAKRLVDAYQGPRLAIAATDLETPMSFQKQFPTITVVAVPGAGHWLMLDKPSEVNAALQEFVERLP
jgi:pimeloyl-ACP methyl ester carboxylesterase